MNKYIGLKNILLRSGKKEKEFEEQWKEEWTFANKNLTFEKKKTREKVNFSIRHLTLRILITSYFIILTLGDKSWC